MQETKYCTVDTSCYQTVPSPPLNASHPQPRPLPSGPPVGHAPPQSGDPSHPGWPRIGRLLTYDARPNELATITQLPPTHLISTMLTGEFPIDELQVFFLGQY